MGRSSGDGCSNSPSPWDCTSSPQSTGGPRAGDTCGGSSGSPRCVRIFRIGSGSVMKLISRISPPQCGTRQRKRLTHPCQQLGPGNPRRVVMARLSINASSRTAAATSRGSQETGMLARLRVPLLADIPNGKRRGRLPQRVVRRKHPVIPMPVLSGRRDQRRQPMN